MDHTTHETADEIVERLLAVVSGLAAKANQPGVEADALRTLADEASEALRTIARPPAAAPLFAQADALAAELLADFDNRQAAAVANGGVVGVRSGITYLDETLNGFEAGKLYMLAAVPGAGKTTVALQWAATVAQAGRVALYVSLENDSLDLGRKLACRLGEVSYARALKGKLSHQEWAAAVGSLHKLGGRLYLSAPRATMPDLETLIEGVMMRAGAAPALIVVDYLQAFTKRMGTGTETADLRERVDRFTPRLRALGEKYGSAILAISSQNRAGYVAGGMSAMKESGDIEYNADAVLTLSKIDKEELKAWQSDLTHDPSTTPLKLMVDKNRQGMTGKPIKLLLYGDLCMVEEEDR